MMDVADFLIELSGGICCFGLLVPAAISFLETFLWTAFDVFGIDLPIKKALKVNLAIFFICVGFGAPIFLLSLVFFSFSTMQ